MDKKKDIQAMAESICYDSCADCSQCQINGLCDYHKESEILYNAGYRKADDLIAENEKLKKQLDDKCDRCIEREHKEIAGQIYCKLYEQGLTNEEIDAIFKSFGAEVETPEEDEQ